MPYNAPEGTGFTDGQFEHTAKKHLNSNSAHRVCSLQSQTVDPPELSNGDSHSHDHNGCCDHQSEDDEKLMHQQMEKAVQMMIQGVGEDAEREGLIDTPKRHAKAMLSFTTGYKQTVRDVIGEAKFAVDHEEMVVIKDINMYSLCEHHLVPFFGTVSIGYIPDKKVLGLSKFSRIVDVFAKRFQVQERITTQVADAIMEELQPKGVAVQITASHMCMMMRGVNQTSSSTTTIARRGCFQTDRQIYREFIDLLPKNK